MTGQSARRGTTAPSRRAVAEAVLEITLLVTRLVTPEVRRLRPMRLSLSHTRGSRFPVRPRSSTGSRAAGSWYGVPPSTIAAGSG